MRMNFIIIMIIIITLLTSIFPRTGYELVGTKMIIIIVKLILYLLTAYNITSQQMSWYMYMLRPICEIAHFTKWASVLPIS